MIYPEVKGLFEAMGHRFYDGGRFNVNLFGIRKGYDKVDMFNDILGIAYRDELGNPVVIESKGTTKPGLYYLNGHLGNVNGTAILQPGNYPKCWEIGLHNGKYEALVQRNPSGTLESVFKVWRDKDQDGRLDPEGPTYRDVTGLNMHTTSFINEVQRVGAYSAGCQVRQSYQDHAIVMQVLRRAADLYGNKFSYTLFEM